MRKLLSIVAILCSLEANAQTYLISFAGEGASTTVTSVIVENLTAGTLVTLNGSQILRLSSTTKVEPSGFGQSAELKIYPNPMSGNSLLQVNPPEAGNAFITISDINGKQLASIKSYLDKSVQEFQLSGFPNGFFMITVQGSSYQFTGKLICNGESDGSIRIDKVSNNTQTEEEKPSETGAKGEPGYIDMGYTAGDLLKYTVISGNYRTIITDIPTSDKTVISAFIPCSDGDNSYSVLEIGNQVWMAQNLKTTKYRNGESIGTTDPYNEDVSGETDPKYQWAYNGNESNVATYGRLYTWYAVTDSRNICPANWHVATDADWTTLSTYLGGVAVAGGKLKEVGTDHWSNPNSGASNETGFTALPGGYRDTDGTFGDIGLYGSWWCSDEYNAAYARERDLTNNSSSVSRTYYYKESGFSVRCVKDPVVTTAVTVSSSTTATGGGNIPDDGSGSIISRGVCWSQSPNPTISNSKTENGSGTGSFVSTITGLTANTTYYIRAYSTSGSKTRYGNELVFKTYTGTVTDAADNVYNTVTIGTQVWMAENLKTTKYRNGDLIGTTTPATFDCSVESTPKYQWSYSGNESNVDTYGRLYTWYAVTDSRYVCPTGWHVPYDIEFTTLTDYLTNNSFGYEGSGSDIAKSLAGSSGWNTNGTAGNTGNNQASNNRSGFTAIPGGARSYGGAFDLIGISGCWWSALERNATTAWYRSISSGSNSVSRLLDGDKKGGYAVRCIQDKLPVVTTADITVISPTSVSCGGNVYFDAGAEVTNKGVCWSTSPNPTISDSKTDDGTGIGSFTSTLSGLTPNTKYYIRAYATNPGGTGYGNEVYLATRGATGTVTDVNGNTYATVEIGTQVWMAENLKTTSGITLVTDQSTWANPFSTTPAYCWYDNNIANKATYGALYNWFAVNTGNLCPTGWHVPSSTEWTTLATYLWSSATAGNRLKESGLSHWNSPNTGATNETGFTALPGGMRSMDGIFGDLGNYGHWWTSTSYDIYSAYWRAINYNESSLYQTGYFKRHGLSVRCVKN